jgi:hypothetical protein
VAVRHNMTQAPGNPLRGSLQLAPTRPQGKANLV